jgi:hypothetical protein
MPWNTLHSPHIPQPEMHGYLFLIYALLSSYEETVNTAASFIFYPFSTFFLSRREMIHGNRNTI